MKIRIDSFECGEIVPVPAPFQEYLARCGFEGEGDGSHGMTRGPAGDHSTICFTNQFVIAKRVELDDNGKCVGDLTLVLTRSPDQKWRQLEMIVPLLGPELPLV